MPSFKDLKKNRMGRTQLADRLEKDDKGKYQQDERIYYPVRDKDGNAKVVIRFLPEKETDLPRVKTYNHGFKGQGGWLVTECPTTIGKPCPVCEINSKLVDEHGGKFDSCPEDVIKTVRNRKRKLSFYSNIMVIKDSANPEKEGKVFLMKYGTKINAKIKNALQPDFDDETPINVFDMWEGADFTWIIKKEDGQTDYSQSYFDKEPSAISDDDTVMEKIYNDMYDLNEFIADERFQSYDDIKQRLDKVLGVESSLPASNENSARASDVSKSVDQSDGSAVELPTGTLVDSTDDKDSLSFFEGLADDDDD